MDEEDRLMGIETGKDLTFSVSERSAGLTYIFPDVDVVFDELELLADEGWVLTVLDDFSAVEDPDTLKT